jgi:hypothetical protein
MASQNLGDLVTPKELEAITGLPRPYWCRAMRANLLWHVPTTPRGRLLTYEAFAWRYLGLSWPRTTDESTAR